MKSLIILGLLVVGLGSTLAHADGIGTKPVAGNVSIQASRLNAIDGWSDARNMIIKIEDVVDGQKVVCYGLSSSSYDGGRALTCLQIQK